VRFEMDLDSKPVTVPVPADLLAAIRKNAAARRYFERLAPSHKKAFVSWIEEAKRPETRRTRIKQAVERMAAGKHVR
jgi:uncharacterized protein YdeI (YjbR/CyaY-like superfamily)